MFIAFEGPDGAGKSTLAPMVARMLSGTVEFRAKSYVPSGEAAPLADMRELRRLLWPASGIPDLLDYPAQYWVLLQAAWYTLASEFTVGPVLDTGGTLIVDGWYYKFLAKASLDALDPVLLRCAFADVAVPDLVVLLEVDLAAAYDRNPSFTFHELGGYQRYSDRGRESYLHHQQRIRDQLLILLPADRMVTVQLPADASAEDNAAMVHSAIDHRLAVAR